MRKLVLVKLQGIGRVLAGCGTPCARFESHRRPTSDTLLGNNPDVEPLLGPMAQHSGGAFRELLLGRRRKHQPFASHTAEE